MNINVIVLAAGKGSRMKSNLDNISKVGYPILGVPVVEYVLNAVDALEPRKIIVVVGHAGEYTTSIVKSRACTVWQKEQKGTGHAVMQAVEHIKEDQEGMTLVLCGDAPLISGETLKKLVDQHIIEGNEETLLSAIVPNQHGYGRIVRDENNNMKKVVEESDADEVTRKINEVNTGVVVFNNRTLLKMLPKLTNNNKKGEYYLTQLIDLYLSENYKINASIMDDYKEMLGINDRSQLAEAAEIMKNRINLKHMLNGVTLVDPKNTYIGPYVKIEADTIIEPNVMISGKTIIGKNNLISMGSNLNNMMIGDDNNIVSSHLVDSTIGNCNNVGPYARLRGNAVITNHAKMGNFSEMKKATLGEGSKLPHLSYVGDATIGRNVNIGCGSIVANYDGVNKSHTDIEDNVFVGSGSILISPVTLNKDAFIAAGSVISNDVESGAMGIARNRQTNKLGYSKILKDIALAKKSKTK